MVLLPNLHAQKMGAQLSVMLNFGTHVNAIGFGGNVYFTQYFIQTNLAYNAKINFSSYGNRKYFFESRFATGILLLAGKKNMSEDLQMDALIHNTKYSYALGYNYLWYWDDIGTSQRSGAWSVFAKHFSLMFENDIFAGQGKDRFRSGTLELAYRIEQTKIFSNLSIWTGETNGSPWIKEAQPSSPNGYKKLDKLPFGKTSHGILSFGVKTILNYNDNSLGRQLSFKTGIDSEQIRHGFQNKISHDLIFLPRSYPIKTPHYPRLNEEGLPIFTKKERKKDRFFMQFSFNELLSLIHI